MALGSLLPELVGGPGRSPLIELVGTWATEKPDAPAFTFVDYSADPGGLKITVDWAETHRRARAMAVRLRQSAEPGDRVALLLPQSLEYMMTMLGAMYSHVIAVPLFSPDLPGHADRLIRAYADAAPTVIVTSEGALPYVQKFLDEHDVPQPKEIVFAESVDPALAADWVDEPIDLDEVAYLQYTSGSTRAPAGVEITHGNVNANARQLWAGWEPESDTPVLVSWLPLFHDMGLIATMALPLVRGDHVVYTAPMSFVMQPLRWMKLISDYDYVYTAGPNFAYEYVAERATPEKLAGIDLSSLVTCLNGAEPIRPATLQAFAEAFAPVGLRAGAQAPGYGLAEATVFVTAAADDAPPKIVSVDREALARGEVVLSAERASSLVSCGRPMGQYVAIVDPEACTEQPDGKVGEIWVHGPNVAPGYWKNSERTQDIFGGVLADPADGLPTAPWLRTGDFGVIHDDELYVTGRIKDLIIVDGRNHYPQDLEVSAQEAHPAIRPDHVAAFPIPGDETEKLVIVAERNRRIPLAQLDLAEVEDSVRAAVNVEHEMRVHEFVLIEPGGISKTSSGKIARAATRQRHLAGDLPTTEARISTRT
jgi:fatty acid CoA ligase FadD32